MAKRRRIPQLTIGTILTVAVWLVAPTSGDSHSNYAPQRLTEPPPGVVTPVPAPSTTLAPPPTTVPPTTTTTVPPTTTTTVPPTTTTTVPPTTTTTAPPPPLPTPAPAPTRPYFEEPLVDLGRIMIPSLGLDRVLHQGISLHNIDRGPSHWPGTALPGELGNVVIAGHRVTMGGPFRNIHELGPGDEVIFEVDGRRSVYAVVGDEVVTPHGLHIVDQRAAHTATLFACHPPGSTAYRYVVHLELAHTSDIPPQA